MAVTFREIYDGTRENEGSPDGYKLVRHFLVTDTESERVFLDAPLLPRMGDTWPYYTIKLTAISYTVTPTDVPRAFRIAIFYDDRILQYRRQQSTTRAIEKYPIMVREPYIYQVGGAVAATGSALVKYQWIEKIIQFERYNMTFSVKVLAPKWGDQDLALCNALINDIHIFFGQFWKYQGVSVDQVGSAPDSPQFYAIEHKWVGDPGFDITDTQIRGITGLEINKDVIPPKNFTAGVEVAFNRPPFYQYIEIPGKFNLTEAAGGRVIIPTGYDLPPPSIRIVPDPGDVPANYGRWRQLPYLPPTFPN